MLKLVNNPFLRRGGNFSLRVQVSLFVFCSHDSVTPFYKTILTLSLYDPTKNKKPLLF